MEHYQVKFTSPDGRVYYGIVIPCSDDEAKQAAKDTGKSVLFVVGEEKTDCDVTARLNLARAKYAAAVQALIQDEAKEKGA